MASRTGPLSQKGLGEPSLRTSAGLLILIFWAVHLLMLTLLANIRGTEDAAHALRRLTLTSVGALLCFGIYSSLVCLRHRRFLEQVLAAAVLSGAAAAIHAALHTNTVYEIVPIARPHSHWTSLIGLAAYWYWFYFCWTAAYLALAYSFAVRDQERRASALQAEAHSAQMRALRYQINPHFLYNTLNSIATLVGEDPKQAEQMVLNLAAFFRTGLAVDPLEDVPLRDEISLQRLYLEIERVRFPKRLHFEIELGRDVEDARVPSLLLQPLIENAVRHGVARSSGVTTIRLAASTRNGRLRLQVSDDGRPAAGSSRSNGTGVGLKNVRNRLAARYGRDFGFTAGPMQPSGYVVSMELPLRV